MNRTQRMMRDLVVAGLVVQVVHFIEHGAQLVHWFANPLDLPWLTPWAVAGRDLLAVDGTPAGGNELLHLVGNLIFLAALVGLGYLAMLTGRRIRAISHLRGAVLLQGAHVFEHLLLTISYFGWGSAAGFTNLFGVAQGAFGSSLRIWAHFLLNLGATYLALRASWEMYQQGLMIHRRSRSRLEPAT